MGSDSDYEEDFIEDDVDADSAEEEELEARIAEEHEKFQQAQEERQARVRETRGWSAPPLESPNPSEQKERKIESAKLSTPEAAASLNVPREDYDPPPRASAGKPSMLQNILEGEEGSSAKTPMGSRHSGAGEQSDEGITPSATAATAAASVVQAVDASGQASGHAEGGVEEEKEKEGDEAITIAFKGGRPGSASSLGRGAKALAKEDEAESGSSEGEEAADGTGDGGGSDEDGEEDVKAGLLGGAPVQTTRPPPLHGAPPSTLTVGSSKVIVASDAGRWVVGDQSSDSLPGLKPRVEEGNEEEEDSEDKSKPGVTPKVTPAAAVTAVLAPAPTPATPPPPLAPAAASPLPPAPASATPVPAAVIPTSLPPPSTKAPVIDDSDVSIVDDDGESIDESPIAHEKPPLVSKPDRSTLAHGAGATRVPPWAVSKPGRYDGAAPSEVGSASAWSRGSGKGDDRRGGAGSEDGEGSDQLKAEEEEARMEPHQFALKLLMHDLRTLPAHRQAVSAAAPPQARRPGSAKAKSRYHESAVAAVLALDSKESTTQIRPAVTSGRPGRPSSAPTARSVDTNPKTQPSTSKTPTKRLVSSAVPKSRGPPSVTSSVGWSTTGGADGTLRTSHMLRAPPSERDEAAPLTTERTPGRLTAELLSGRGSSWDGGHERQQEGRGWSSPATAAVKQRPMSARPGYTAAGSASLGARGVPPRPRPFSAQLPGGQRASLEGTPATAFGAWVEAGGAGSGPGAHSGAHYPISGNAAAVEIYTSSTQKQVAAANRCLAALGSNRRYRTRTPTDNMNVQLVVQGYEDGDGEVTVLKTLSVTQFMAVLRQLKAKVRAQHQQQQAKPSLASLASAAGYTNDLDSDWVSPITTLWEGDTGNSIIGTKGSDGLIFRASEMDDWLLGGGDEGYDGMGPDASLPPPLPEDDPADQVPSVTQAVHEQINAAARRCQELAMQISMLQQDVPKGRQQERQGRRW